MTAGSDGCATVTPAPANALSAIASAGALSPSALGPPLQLPQSLARSSAAAVVRGSSVPVAALEGVGVGGDAADAADACPAVLNILPRFFFAAGCGGKGAGQACDATGFACVAPPPFSAAAALPPPADEPVARRRQVCCVGPTAATAAAAASASASAAAAAAAAVPLSRLPEVDRNARVWERGSDGFRRPTRRSQPSNAAGKPAAPRSARMTSQGRDSTCLHALPGASKHTSVLHLRARVRGSRASRPYAATLRAARLSKGGKRSEKEPVAPSAASVASAAARSAAGLAPLPPTYSSSVVGKSPTKSSRRTTIGATRSARHA